MWRTPAAAAAPSAVRAARLSEIRIAAASGGGRVRYLAQELAQVAGEVVERAARRGDVDEPEQGGFELLVGRGEVHRPGVERPQRVAGARGKRGRQIGADLADGELERRRPRSAVVADRLRIHERMLTARATTSPTVTSEASDWPLISHLAMGVSGIVSVGLKAVAFVNETYR